VGFLLLDIATVETILRRLDYLKPACLEVHILAMVFFLLFDTRGISLLFLFIFRYLPYAKIVMKTSKLARAHAVLFVLGKFVRALSSKALEPNNERKIDSCARIPRENQTGNLTKHTKTKVASLKACRDFLFIDP